MKPLISVIIPVYNRESKIHIALDSLINQTFQDFEVVIVDDGSVDRTAQVIEKYTNTDSRFKYIYQKNAGVSSARNKGIEKAKGNYISFLDSDDYYDSTFLEKMYSKISEKKADVCYCSFYNVTAKGKSPSITVFKEGDILIDYILENVKINTNCWLIKKKLLHLNDLHFPTNVSWGEDVEFFSEVLSKTKNVCCVKEFLTYYVRKGDESNLSSFSLDKLDKDFSSISRMCQNLGADSDLKLKKALINYRLSAVITYRLLNAIKKNWDKTDILNYFEKYKDYILTFSFNNGLRSVKLNLSKVLLIYKLNKLKKS
ncbi:glycosyltransferase family 2 protein [Calidifontibacillus erzurumensis]|uniref:Glycosyltransferase family 2 protein n=1 Tax=Calidifontibacillus erzurumensis TaxID=2741433 RepID=A0A8J8K950_9BACI|nr:glycosyltransferase family 2 protein [Calidifontibacillus erzurumensis]NSL52731.1 glycosyltransferase family 2 protein [Calidifontibacillus erzurumensis]